MDAYLPSLNQNVIIISMPDSKGDVQVEAGIMKITVKLKDLRKIKNKSIKKEKKKRVDLCNIYNVKCRIIYYYKKILCKTSIYLICKSKNKYKNTYYATGYKKIN